MNIKVDVKFIKGFIAEIGNQALSAVKIILKLPYFKTYLLVSVIMTFFFTILTFPYDELIKSKIKGFEKNLVKSIEIGELEYSIIGLSHAENISIATSPGKEIYIESLLLDDNFNPYSLILSKNFQGSLQLKNLSYKSDNVDLLSSINCNYTVLVNDFSLKGIQSASVKTMFENTKLNLTNITLPAEMGGLSLTIPPLVFSVIKANISLNDGIVHFDEFKITGSQLRGSINGTITLSRIVASSKLEVTITIGSESTAIEPYKDFLGSYTNGDGDIVLPLGGTISRPRIQKKTETE